VNRLQSSRRTALPAAAALLLLAPPAGGAGIGDFYSVEPVPTPPGVDAQVGALDVLPGGEVVVGFHRGEIFFFQPASGTWQRFADGLHEPLGLVALDRREVLVMQRPELTRLRDTDGDGTADRYESAWDGFGMTGNYHEFAYGPVRDPQGNLYVALNLASNGDGVRREFRGPWSPLGPSHDDFFLRWKSTKEGIWKMFSRVPWRGWVIKLDRDTLSPTPWSCGWRSPDGLGFDDRGRLFVTDNQGDWVGTSALFLTGEGRFHGHPASLVWRDGWSVDPQSMQAADFDALRTPPVVVFPHGLMANSPTQPVCDRTGGAFGPFAGQMIVGEMNTPRLLRVMLDEVNGRLQGACVPFLDGGGLRAGNHRLAFGPDASLWVGQTHLAWAGGAGLQRIKWTGRTPLEVLRLQLQPGGFLFTFTKPLAPDTATAPWRIRHYHYAYHAAYGSPQLGLATIPSPAVELRDHARQLWLPLPRILDRGEVYEFTLPPLAADDGTPLLHRTVCYTVNAAPTD
jgi:glucose/arabinose dehydrogenase